MQKVVGSSPISRFPSPAPAGLFLCPRGADALARCQPSVGESDGPTPTRRIGTMVPAARVVSGSCRTRRVAVTTLAACVLMLLGAATGWAKGRIAWHGCGPEQPANVQCGE